MTLRAVFFDLGGTLLHYHDPLQDDPRRAFRRVTLEGIRRMVEHLLAEQALPLSLEEVTALIDRHIGQAYMASLQELRGGSIEEPIRAALGEAGALLSDGRWAELRHHFYSVIDTIVAPREGVRETLEVLKARGYQMAIISNSYWASDLHDRHLAQYGLLDFFPLRLYSCDTPYMKPHPAIFRQALDALGLAPQEVAYVGDRPDVDVAGAQQVGMYGVLIASPYRTEGLGDVVPHATITELPELPDALITLGVPSP